ncbi:histidine kinase-like protein [Amycolatopsis echigonensis]|uniref:Histidine kinase-like protein n=1 Tax=Amycolatopsis echigonensis TaxID=2576905 RepID=A0A2N3WUH1_9PSEU|nr:ATP-binding protein [Amycolatopsis niigatensis]PKV97526.1 histidine kinase-like protein [Amycolatopsis niigatensis]
MSVDEFRHSRLPVRAASPEGGAARLDLVLGRDFPALRQVRDEAVAFVRRHRPHAAPDAVADASLVLDEMASNAMRHARPPCDLALSLRGDRLLIEVSDSLPVLARCREGYEGGGRGLALIDALAARWGQTPGAGGKTVWAELPL